MLNNKKNNFALILLLSGVVISSWGQKENKQIVKLIYTSSPISQYEMTEEDMRSTPTEASLHDFMKGIKDYYSLYINLEDRSSVYVLDSTVQVKPRGYEDSRAALMDSVLFTVKTPKNITLKHEWIMNQTFFTEGQVGDIKWELINEEKTIDGLSCKKAITKEDNYPMLTVWYTKDLPVSNGPSIYQGLPGLVVRSEDYSRTTELLKIEYISDNQEFKTLYKTKYDTFIKEKKRKKHYGKEPILIIEKGELGKSYYESNHGKPYKRTKSK